MPAAVLHLLEQSLRQLDYYVWRDNGEGDGEHQGDNGDGDPRALLENIIPGCARVRPPSRGSSYCKSTFIFHLK